MGLLLTALLFLGTLDAPAASRVALGLAHMAVVVVASWRFRLGGRWATVALAAVAWTSAMPELRELGWPSLLPRRIWWDGAVRLGILASLAATVSAFRHALRRLLRAEDALAVSLLRERDSARRDRLTRLWNARYLHEALGQEIARCRRYGRPFGLLLVDLDGFKAVNDLAGHEAGDAVLQTVAQILRTGCRATDFPARLGGDEFAIILPEASSLTVPRYAAKLVDAIAQAPFPPGLPPVTASVGGVAFTVAPASATTALAAADAAMYAAKRRGKNSFVVASEEREA